ncbi:MAG: sugar transferase [Henriciella sp.]|nr:sugar transferase [Henriciella sp.]
MGYQPYTGDLQNAEFVAKAHKPLAWYISNFFKRTADILIVLAAALFLLPVLVPIALIIRLSDNGPILFRHKRIGRDGKEFMLYKFRSMVPDASERLEHLLETDPAARAEWMATRKLENDPRITPIGDFLRKSSLDELPQLLNIFKGQMSVVGPRPIVEGEIEKYGEFFSYYTSVRPGLTGLWQVSGRSETTYETRVALDVAYVKARSFFMDIKIILMTFPAVLRRAGAR